MKREKGFTLIELLAVLTLLVVIATIAFPNIVNLIKQNKTNEYNTFASLIEQATELYVERNIDDYPELSTPSGVAFIPVSDLVADDYIKANATDPNSEELATDYNVIVITNADNTKTYKYNGSKSVISSYAQSGLVLHYDAIENNGVDSHSVTTTTWQDLSSANNDSTVIADWKGDNLYLSGSTITTGLSADSTFAITNDYTLSITFKISGIPSTSSTYGYTGVIFGKANDSGAGMVWVRDEDNPNIDINTFVGTTSVLRYSKVITYNVVPTDIYEVTLVYSNTNSKVYTYLNGELIDSKTSVTGVFNGLGNIVINGDGVYTGDYETDIASMHIYSAKIYNRALTKEEVASNYEVDEYRFDL